MTPEKVILGLSEEIIVFGPNGKEEKVKARIDTGATSSSLDLKLAESLELYPGIKTRMVRSASGMKRRAMIKVKIKLDGQIIEEGFTLADRSQMNYPALIGQNILKRGEFLVDPKK